MRFDCNAQMTMQRRALSRLTQKFVMDDNGGKQPNKHYVPPKLTSSPAMLIQELPWVNTTQTFSFNFSLTGPLQTPGTNNNITIAKNDVFAIYALQILFATGTNSADFIYRSHGVLPSDDSLYNSIITMKTENNTFIDKMEGQFFRDNPANSNEYYGEIGIQIINPIRVISGELGVFNITITLKNPIAMLVISDNTMVSLRLHGVYGQAQG